MCVAWITGVVSFATTMAVELDPFVALVLVVLGNPGAHVQRVADMARPRLRTVLPMWIQAGKITLWLSAQLQQRMIVPV